MKLLLKTVAALMVIAALLIGFLTLSSPGRFVLASTVSSFASDETQIVKISDLSGLWSGNLEVGSIKVSDPRGTWLEVSNVSVTWKPSQLLTSRFSASDIRIGKIHVMRQPEPAQDRQETDSGSTLPLDIEIDNVLIEELALGGEIAGTPASFRLNSKIAIIADLSEAELGLNVRRMDGKTGQLDLVAVYRPDEGEVDLKGNLQEETGGILAHMLQLQGSPAIGISLDGSGPADNWEFSLATNLNSQTVLDVDGKLSADSDRQHVRLKGIGRPKDLMPPKYRALVGEAFDLDLDIVSHKSGKVQVTRAKVDFERFFFAATGTYDPRGSNQITGGFQTREAGLDLAGDIIPGMTHLVPRNLAFSIAGSGEKARVDFLADIPLIATGDITANGLRAQFTAPDFNLAEQSGKWQLDAQVDSVDSPDPDIAGFLAGAQSLTARGTLNQDSINADLMEFSNPSVIAKTTARYSLADGSWDADLDTRISPNALPENLRGFFRTEISSTGKLAGNTGGSLFVKDLKLEGGALKGQGNLEIHDNDLDARFELDASSLAGLLEGFNAALNAQLKLSGTLNEPTVDLRVNGDDLVFNSHRGEDLRLSVSGHASPQAPDLSVSLSGLLDGQPITGETRLITRNGQRRLEQLSVENGPNNIRGSLEFDDRFSPFGTIDIDLPRLETLAALALQEMSGSLVGKIRFDLEAGKPNLNVAVQSDRLVYQENTISGLNAAVSLLNYREAPQPKGNLSVDRINNGANTIRGLSADFIQMQDWTEFTVTANANEVPLDLAGRVRSGEQIDLEISKADAQVQGVGVRLAETALIRIADNIVNLNRILLQVGSGQIAVSGNVSDRLNVAARITGLEAALANQFAKDLGASGQISGDISITGATSAPVVSYDLSLGRFSLAQTREIGISPLAIASKGNFQNNRLELRFSVTGPSGLKISGGGTVDLNNTVILNLAFAGDVPFPVLAKQLGNQGILLEGAAKLDVKVSGPANRPQISGNIASQGARLVHAASGIAIKNIVLALSVADETARIDKLTGELSTGGRLTAGGTIGLAANGGFPADIKLDVNNGVFTDHKSVTSEFDADIRLSGSLINGPLISGVVNLNRTTVTIPERLPPSIAKLDITHKNAAKDVSAQVEGLAPSGRSSASGVRLDLQIRALQKIFIRGRGLDAELGGELKLIGAVSNPNALGAFQVRRGRFSILGKRLDFTRGDMKFSGSLVPDLNMRAETQRDEYTIYIDVIGRADNPQFRFSSSPTLAEDEVLARLIFGAELRSLSALQIIKLGQAAATLTGYGGNSSLLDKFQGLIQADDLDVKTDETTGETTVGVGKYINDQIYVGVERGAKAASGKARIDLSIGRGLKLRGEATEDGQNKAGIFFEKDY